MASYSSDRRSILKIFGSIGATCAYPFASDELQGQTIHTHAAEQAAPPESPEQHFLNATDFSTVARIADLIIPETDTPGASAAGVPAYIDRVIARNTDHQYTVADGLRWLDKEAVGQGASNFLALSEGAQIAILEPLCERADGTSEAYERGRNVQFFALIKSLTADGYYTSHAGLVEELKYRGNTPQAHFPSCSA